MRYLKELYRFFRHIVESRQLLFTLVKNDFKKQYLGSCLGLLWAFIQPIIFILVIWFVFEVGFRSRSVGSDSPFFLWLICGMIPWFFFVEAVSTGTNAIVSNQFLIRKVAFRVGVLPLVPIASALIIHLFLFVLLIGVFFCYGRMPSIYWLQGPYFLVCTVFLILGITWFTSALKVFVKDVGNVVGVFLQIGFWVTPIFWSLDMVPAQYQYIIKLNPMVYVVNGYRDTFIYHVWFWENVTISLYFWVVTFIMFVVGVIVFKRLRPHFGDVL